MSLKSRGGGEDGRVASLYPIVGIVKHLKRLVFVASLIMMIPSRMLSNY